MKGLKTDWLLVGDGTTVHHGALVVDSHHTIVAVGALSDLQARFAHVAFDHYPGMLMPGLLNLHTHLELSDLMGKLPEGRGFGPWAAALMSVRSDTMGQGAAVIVEKAIAQAHAAGTALVVDISNSGSTIDALSRSPMLSQVMLEVLGLEKARAERALELALALKKEKQSLVSRVRVNVAPHSPYGIHSDVLGALLKRSANAQLPTSIHLAEHRPEREWLMTQSGPLAEFFNTIGFAAEEKPAGVDPITFGERVGLFDHDVLCVHGANLSDDEIERAATLNAKYVLCPRSNAFIEGDRPPLEHMLARGMKLALGTDSLASNYDLDVLKEAALLLRDFPKVAPSTLVAMLCANAADHMHLGYLLGRLTRGCRPGVLHIAAPANLQDPQRYLLSEVPDERAWVIPHAHVFESAGIQ